MRSDCGLGGARGLQLESQNCIPPFSSHWQRMVNPLLVVTANIGRARKLLQYPPPPSFQTSLTLGYRYCDILTTKEFCMGVDSCCVNSSFAFPDVKYCLRRIALLMPFLRSRIKQTFIGALLRSIQCCECSFILNIFHRRELRIQ